MKREGERLRKVGRVRALGVFRRRARHLALRKHLHDARYGFLITGTEHFAIDDLQQASNCEVVFERELAGGVELTRGSQSKLRGHGGVLGEVNQSSGGGF